MYRSDQARKSDQARMPDLGSRYGEIGISAVAAALHYRSGMEIGVGGQRAKRSGGRDAIQKSNRMGSSGQVGGSRARSR
jgi:hypothetical protein